MAANEWLGEHGNETARQRGGGGGALRSDVRLRLSTIALLAAAVATDVAAGHAISLMWREMHQYMPHDRE
eukprot:364109-Chlamydomonas_euryale.AAC.14